MACNILEGWETISSATEFNRKFVLVAGEPPVADNFRWVSGRNFGQAYKSRLERALLLDGTLSSQATRICGSAVKATEELFTNQPDMRLFEFWDTSTVQCYVKLVNNGDAFDSYDLEAWRDDGTTPVMLGKANVALVPTAWYYIEAKVTINNTTGAFIVRVNTAPVITLSNVDTQRTANASTNNWGWRAPRDFLLDDMYVFDSTTADCNDFWGDAAIEGSFATSDIAGFVDWTASSGTDRFAMIDEADVDDDATYVFADTADSELICGFGNLVFAEGNIGAVQIEATNRITSAGSRDIKLLSRDPNTTIIDRSDIKVVNTTAYAMKRHIFHRDPNGAVWTKTLVDAAQFGIELDA